MCGRLACTLNPEYLEGACCYLNDQQLWTRPKWISGKYKYKPFYNGPPTTILPVLAHKSHFPENNDVNCSEYVLVPMRWSLSSTWTNVKTSYHTHNARIESLLKSPLYKPHVVEGRRCFIIADGYYEWQTTQSAIKKQPYFLYKEPWGQRKLLEMNWDKYNGWSGKYMIKLAGIFNVVKEEDGYSYTCSVITAESNDSLAWLHNRMPILCDYDYSIHKWIDREQIGSDEIIEYLNDINSMKLTEFLSLKHHAVDPSLVNNTSCDDPKCMDSVNIKSSRTLDTWFTKSTTK